MWPSDGSLAVLPQWLDHKQEVTLDYEGRLFLTMFRMRRDALSLARADGSLRAAWRPARPTCFVHDNGANLAGVGFGLHRLLPAT